MLLTSQFSSAGDAPHKPLTPTEWGRFAIWLKKQGAQPEDLINSGPQKLLTEWSDKKVSLERISYLLDRGCALGLATEKWLRAGLWILTRSDKDYPKLLKRKLGTTSPAVLFGCGNKNLLQGEALAIVGSRNASKSNLEYSRELGRLSATQGFNILSGGARGVDESAMLGSLEEEGNAVGVLANSLLGASISQKYRAYLKDNRLALISSRYPEARFTVGNAMERNKYIYCLSRAAVVVHSGVTGGTWSGATENLKKKWVPLWVKTSDSEAANSQLINMGAKRLSDDLSCVKVSSLFMSCSDGSNQSNKSALSSDISEEQSKAASIADNGSRKIYRRESEHTDGAVDSSMYRGNGSGSPSLYQLFLHKVMILCKEREMKPDAIASELELGKTQTGIWLKQAVTNGQLRKLKRPVRYELNHSSQNVLDI